MIGERTGIAPVPEHDAGRVEGGELRLQAVARNAALCFETEDTYVGLVLRLMRMVYQEDLRPLRLTLRRPMPASARRFPSFS